MQARAALFLLMAVGGLCARPAHAADISAELGIVSDYRYRGLSLSEGKPAAQASVTLEHDNGLYAGIWTSTIREDDFDADLELDLAAGFIKSIADGVTADFSVTYFAYPGEARSNYVEATLAAEAGEGPWSASMGLSLVPGQRGTRDENGRAHANFYAFAGISHELTGLPLILSARLGHERGYFDEADDGGKWDWSVGVQAKLGRIRIGSEYVGSNVSSDRHALVASLFVDF